MPVQHATAKFLKKDDEDQASEFVSSRLVTVTDPADATTDAQVVRAFRTYIGGRGISGLKDARESMERHLFYVPSNGRRLYRLKGAQHGFIQLDPNAPLQ